MNELPSEFKHLRNIINSSVPQGMTFPNALNQFVSIDSIEETLKCSPNVAVSLVNDLGSFKKPLDSFLRIPSSSLNRNIMNQIAQLNPSDTAENFKIINAIVTHSVVLAGDELLSTSKQVILSETSSYFNLLSNLITNTITEKKDIAMNVIDCLVNHLRFPNTQTYFSWYVLTTVFNIDLNDKELTKKLNWNEESLGAAQEMILRSLLDRLLVSKPHPWGCVMTLMSILKKIDNVEDLNFVNKDVSSGESVYGLMTSMKSLFEKTNNKVEVQ
jgi:CCR4-NOT transcription complex subunit 1